MSAKRYTARIEDPFFLVDRAALGHRFRSGSDACCEQRARITTVLTGIVLVSICGASSLVWRADSGWVTRSEHAARWRARRESASGRAPRPPVRTRATPDHPAAIVLSEAPHNTALHLSSRALSVGGRTDHGGGSIIGRRYHVRVCSLGHRWARLASERERWADETTNPEAGRLGAGR